MEQSKHWFMERMSTMRYWKLLEIEEEVEEYAIIRITELERTRPLRQQQWTY